MRSQYTDRSLVSKDHKIGQDMTRDFQPQEGGRGDSAEKMEAIISSHHSTRGVGVRKCKAVFTGRHYPRKIAGVRNDVPGQGHCDILMVQQTITIVPEIIFGVH